MMKEIIKKRSKPILSSSIRQSKSENNKRQVDLEANNNQLFEVYNQREETKSISQILKEFVFFMWDGVKFFDLQAHHLKRMRDDSRPKVSDKLVSETWIIGLISVLIIGIYILASQISNVGKIA